MKEHQVRSAAGMLLGMAAGAAVGAAGVMAAVHTDPRGVRKAARKMAKGAQALRPAVFLCPATLYRTAMHIRAVRLVSPSRSTSISMAQVTISERLTLLPVSTEEGRLRMVRTALPSSRLPETSPS